MNKTTPSLKNFLAPKFWPTWLGISLIWLIAYLPFTLRLKIGSALGWLTYWLANERRYITHLNFTLCFPELSANEHHELSRKCFRENGIGLIETTTSWVRGPEPFRDMLTLTGTEHMDKAIAKGQGVLLLGAHYTTLDFSANLLSQHYPFGVTYRAHKNPLFDAFMLRGRLKICNGVFDRNDIRGAFKHLKKGLVLWYAPDQDYGSEHAVYAPFFGRTAATITAGSRFASINKSTTLLIRHHRDGDSKRYEIEFIPVPESFPSDDQTDATLINEMIETAIQTCPEQYLWMHKRFKTQAKGKPASPYINIKTAKKKISTARFNSLVEDAVILTDSSSLQSTLRLNTGMKLSKFPGNIKRLTEGRHPAIRFDVNAKKLRLNNIASITCDVIYKVSELNFTAVTYFELEGDSINTLASEQVPLTALAILFAKLHEHGFLLRNIKKDKLILLSNNEIAIENPEDIKIFPTSLCYFDRLKNLKLLLTQFNLQKEQTQKFCNLYLNLSGLEKIESFKKLLEEL